MALYAGALCRPALVRLFLRRRAFLTSLHCIVENEFNLRVHTAEFILSPFLHLIPELGIDS